MDPITREALLVTPGSNLCPYATSGMFIYQRTWLYTLAKFFHEALSILTGH